MKVHVTVSLCLLAVLSAAFFFRDTSASRRVPLHIAQAYSRWAQEFGKLYATPAERDYRLSVFYDQSLFIEQSNQEYQRAAEAAGQTLSGPMFEMNGFGDLTTEEFEARYTGEVHEEELVPVEPEEPSVPEPQNLSASNLGSGYSIIIRQQGSCGSCWAFSAVAALEKFYFDKQNSRVEFSQQELVDCDSGSSGCNGGSSGGAFSYTAKNGLSLASKYPYTGSTGSCKSSKSSPVKIGNYPTDVRTYSQKKAVLYSSKDIHASVSLYSSGKFKYASSSSDILDGKLTGECNTSTNHAINMKSASGDTIRVFNSWGTRWGEGGFKTIKVCSETNLYGANGSKIRHPYGNI